MATGAIRYNYNREVWEFSNNGMSYNEFANRQHTHASAEIADASPSPNAGSVVRRGALGEAAFGRVTVGNARLESLFLTLGSPNGVSDPDERTIPNLSISGTTSNFKIAIQDIAGQVNFLWNSTRATNNNDRYLVSSEAASRITIKTEADGSSFGIFSAPAGLANQTIAWRQRLLLRSNGTLSFGPATDEILEVNVNGNVTLRRGKIYAQAFETQSARKLKHSIAPFTETALGILNAIVVYSYIYERDETNQRRIGIMADDVTDTRIVGENHDRFDVTSTVGLLIKAVQELSQRIDVLERAQR
jgi:hypothetical protein